MYMSVYIYMYIHICTYVYIYIHIYIYLEDSQNPLLEIILTKQHTGMTEVCGQTAHICF